MKKMKRYFLWTVAFLLLFVSSGCAKASEETEVIVFAVGQADAFLLLSGEHAVLIDAGEKQDGEEILRFLSKKEVDSLDLMIITHFDKDHVGGADAILMGIPIQAVYDADYETSTKHYRAYTEALKMAGVPRYRVSKETTLTVGGWSLSLLPTVMREAKDNDRSLIVVAEDSWRRFFFAADAEEARIAELLEMGLDKVDLVKMPHHGRYHSSLPDFLEALDAEIAVITDSQKKPAHEKTLSLLEKKGIEIFQTANGEIHIKSRNDGLLILQ